MAVYYGIFHHIDGNFVVETSGGKYHSCASVDDLKNLFHAIGDDFITVKDSTARWCEAQLLHYGLPPSKVKGTAATRLLDELNKGTLRVPKNFLKLEERMESEWYIKGADEEASPHGSEAQQVWLGQTSAEPERSANDLDLDLSRLSLKEKSEENQFTPERANNDRYILDGDAPKGVSAPITRVQLRPSPRANKQRSNCSSGQKIKTEQETKEHAERPSPPPPRSPGYKPLGLINGVYSISCPSIKRQHGSSERSIILCLNSPCVWGSYDFGLYFGIFLLEQRPYRVSDEPLPIQWRGLEYGVGTMAPEEGTLLG